ncbi:cytochrome c [Salicola sp. Rm-C-2C1-2]|uniref:c-type cytochrome n=1 Tax=Salicola sp. Rm-C-2C1-2 TaxID=3141321 RepID=UPI0032E4099D
MTTAVLALPAQAADSGKSELRELVVQDCGSCHGLKLGGGLGPGLRAGDLKGRSIEAIAAIIREGVPGTAMPPWRDLLSDQEIQWISEQLKSGALIKSDDSR